MRARWNLGRLCRFSLGTLLFVMLCVAGYFGGYRRGFDDGKEDQQAGVVSVRSYTVADLVASSAPAASEEEKAASFDELIDLIVSAVEHDSWVENGAGMGEIQPFFANNSLVISQTTRVHNQVALLLEQLRKLRTQVDVTEMIPLLQSMAAMGRQERVTIRAFEDSKRGGGSAELLFDSAVSNLADRWGEPEFRGVATDRDFPSWSVAQRLATWPKGEGLAYLAVQDDAHDGRVLQVGWHAEK